MLQIRDTLLRTETLFSCFMDILYARQSHKQYVICDVSMTKILSVISDWLSDWLYLFLLPPFLPQGLPGPPGLPGEKVRVAGINKLTSYPPPPPFWSSSHRISPSGDVTGKCKCDETGSDVTGSGVVPPLLQGDRLSFVSEKGEKVRETQAFETLFQYGLWSRTEAFAEEGTNTENVPVLDLCYKCNTYLNSISRECGFFPS